MNPRYVPAPNMKHRIDDLETLFQRRPRKSSGGTNCMVYLSSIGVILRQSQHVYSVHDVSVRGWEKVYEMIGSHYQLTFEYNANQNEDAADLNHQPSLLQRLRAIQKHSFDAYNAISIETCCPQIAKGLNGILTELAFIFPSWNPLHVHYEE